MDLLSSYMAKKVIIVVVTYNSSRIIRKCLNLIKGYNVIVVDNCSKDDTVKIVKKYPVRLIVNSKNLGYGKAANIGIKKSKSKYILLINPDVFINPKEIDKMVKFMENHPNCDVQGSKLLDKDGKLLYSCHRFPTFTSMVGRRLGFSEKGVYKYLMKDYDHKMPRKVDWVSGGCMMFKSRYLFDERYFLYLEDVDFCIGKGVWYNPGAFAVHIVQRESAKKLSSLLIHIMSLMKFLLKHRGRYIVYR